MKLLSLKDDVGYYYNVYSNCGQENIGFYASGEFFFLRPSRLLAPLDFENVETGVAMSEVLGECLKNMFGIAEDE